MKRRLPKGVRLEYAERAKDQGVTRKPPKELFHKWVSAEKRRTHKRERREGKRTVEDES